MQVSAEPTQMRNLAPYPEALADVVARLTYKGWRIWLEDLDRGQGSVGLTLIIQSATPDAYAPPDRGETVCGQPHPQMINVRHFFIVPAAAYDQPTWMRWVFDCCLLVETHEAMEFFQVDGSRPFAPLHGPGKNPHSIHERSTDAEANTDQRGERAFRLA